MEMLATLVVFFVFRKSTHASFRFFLDIVLLHVYFLRENFDLKQKCALCGI